MGATPRPMVGLGGLAVALPDSLKAQQAAEADSGGHLGQRRRCPVLAGRRSAHVSVREDARLAPERALDYRSWGGPHPTTMARRTEPR